MKTFKQYTEACWTGYTAKGMKKKGNRMVPNCVPEETEALSLDYGNASIHHSKEAALSKATKLHKAGYVGITLKVHPNGLHVVDHEQNNRVFTGNLSRSRAARAAFRTLPSTARMLGRRRKAPLEHNPPPNERERISGMTPPKKGGRRAGAVRMVTLRLVLLRSS
jgi:hypothetical protein